MAITGSISAIQWVSLVLLLIGIWLAFSQIQLSGWILGWILLSGALLLQGFRSMLSYLAQSGGVDAATYTIANDWMGLGFSLLIVAAMKMLRQVFGHHRLEAENLRLFSAAANDAIIVMDEAGTIVIWNPAAERVFGYGVDEARGNKIAELIVPERYRIEFERLLARLDGEGRKSGGAGPTNVIGMLKDGTEIVTEYVVSRTQIDGKSHAVCIVRDISARQRAEKTLGRIKHLEGLLSICIHCKKIRAENNDWQQLEKYITEHSDAGFSHGLCPGCLAEQMKKLG
ncbi:MAG: hypothetical protein A3H32_08625 [Betaproteobacteria bacterium RIFCSPLOWO2_02_FULL_63_19]|nr:MAG: hypothetical protein A3H32_08625 [Betaproteobacteria bacterium RIFCSPLOWO2_02_FULL_63_19]